MPPSSRCGSGTPKTPQFLARGITAAKLMPASISAVGSSLRAHPRDPTTIVRRQVEARETRHSLNLTAKPLQDLSKEYEWRATTDAVSFARGFLLVIDNLRRPVTIER